jgi:hypothetical protein
MENLRRFWFYLTFIFLIALISSTFAYVQFLRVKKARLGLVLNSGFEWSREGNPCLPKDWFYSDRDELEEKDTLEWNYLPLSFERHWGSRAIIVNIPQMYKAGYAWIFSRAIRNPKSGHHKLVFYFKPHNLSRIGPKGTYGFVFIDYFKANGTFIDDLAMEFDEVQVRGYDITDEQDWVLELEDAGEGWKKIIARTSNPRQGDFLRIALTFDCGDCSQVNENSYIIYDDILFIQG